MPNTFTLLTNNNAAKYLPEVEISMAMKQMNDDSSNNIKHSDNDKWNRLRRFESDIYDGMLYLCYLDCKTNSLLRKM